MMRVMFRDAEYFNEQFEGEFERADFSHSELTNCDFADCDLRRSEWLGAVLHGCDFVRCDFRSALLTGVSFESCSFVDCSFDEAYLFRSRMINCGVSGSSMNDAMISTVNFDGTEFHNLHWKGTCINSPPLIVEGIEYPVVALDNGYMHVGCEFNTYDWFWNTDEKHSAAMEGLRARRFWKRNKQWIFDMLKARKLYDYTAG